MNTLIVSKPTSVLCVAAFIKARADLKGMAVYLAVFDCAFNFWGACTLTGFNLLPMPRLYIGAHVPISLREVPIYRLIVQHALQQRYAEGNSPLPSHKGLAIPL